MVIRKRLQAELNSLSAQITKAKAAVRLLKAEIAPSLFPADDQMRLILAQNRVVELEHRYRRTNDNYRTICGA